MAKTSAGFHLSPVPFASEVYTVLTPLSFAFFEMYFARSLKAPLTDGSPISLEKSTNNELQKGKKGILKVNNPTLSEIEIAKDAGTNKDRLHYFFMTRYIDAYKNQINYFIDCIKKRSMPKPDSFDGYYALYLAENALKTARTGRTDFLS